MNVDAPKEAVRQRGVLKIADAKFSRCDFEKQNSQIAKLSDGSGASISLASGSGA
jgi:hypothetical protein